MSAQDQGPAVVSGRGLPGRHRSRRSRIVGPVAIAAVAMFLAVLAVTATSQPGAAARLEVDAGPVHYWEVLGGVPTVPEPGAEVEDPPAVTDSGDTADLVDPATGSSPAPHDPTGGTEPVPEGSETPDDPDDPADPEGAPVLDDQ